MAVKAAVVVFREAKYIIVITAEILLKFVGLRVEKHNWSNRRNRSRSSSYGDGDIICSDSRKCTGSCCIFPLR